MESPEVALKRRVLVDALTMCLQRSKVCEKVDASTIRSVLENSPDLWRGGEFHLETVWKILCNQPGLTAKEVAPPLLVFKAYENELGVVVRVPQALSALPRSEQVRLRDELGIPRAEFAGAITQMQKLATDEAQRTQQTELAERASRQMDSAPKESPSVPQPARPQANKAVPPGVIAGAVAFALALGGGIAWLQLRDHSEAFDTSDVAPLLKLDAGRREGPSLIARIADPKWEPLPAAEKQQLAGQILDLEAKKGVKAIVLTDDSGKTRVNAFFAGANRVVTAR